MTPHHVEVLEALVNRIIPADEFPGGWEAGVGNYLLRQFDGDLSAQFSIYMMGLEALDAEAAVTCREHFAKLSALAQDELLRCIEAGTVKTLWLVDPSVFFRMVVEHCAEGYYSDPGSGGNINGISWQMIGFQVEE